MPSDATFPIVNIINWLPGLLVAGLYQRGVWRLWARAGGGRGISFARYAAFMVGLLVLFAALLSPLEAWASQLFTAHMVQHVLLMFVAAPLLAIGHPAYVGLWALPRAWSRRIGQLYNRLPALHQLLRIITQPVWAWLFFVSMVWVWHIPALYEAALMHDTIHIIEHACFLLAAFVFWQSALQPAAGQQGISALLLALTMLQGTFLSILIVFSPQAWYGYYAATTRDWGLSPLADQQLAGVVMGVPGGILCMILAVLYFLRWLNDLNARHPARKNPSPHPL